MYLYPRLAALISVTFWSSGALFVLGLNQIPPFFLLAVSSSICLVFTAVFLFLSDRWSLVTSCIKPLCSLGVLIILNQACYVFAFRLAPAAQVDLINYLWPSMLVLFMGNFQRAYTKYVVVALGAGGIFLALEPGALSLTYLTGYLAAFVAALSWTIYSFVVKNYSLPTESACINLGLGAPVFWCLHFFSNESFVSLTGAEVFLLLLYGGGVYVVAYLCWGYAVKYGSIGESSALSYMIPLLSVGLLVMCGYAELTPRISWATTLILLAALTPVLEGIPVYGKNRVKALQS